MSTGSSPPQNDPLTKLRIPRQHSHSSSITRQTLKLLLLLSALALASSGIWLLVLSDQPLPLPAALSDAVRTKPEVRIALVSAESGLAPDATVVATGYIESRQQARIGARATGRIQNVLVEEGSKVNTNDVLAILEHADLDAALAAADAAASRSNSELLEQDVAIRRSQKDLERAEKAFAANTMTAAEFDNQKFEYDAAVAHRKSLEAALMLAQARVLEARQLRENMFIRAPFPGTVISKDAELGESIMPGGMGEASGRGSVVTIADLEHLEVDCDVKEDFISQITPGQLAEINVDAVPGRRYQGTVRKIIPMGDRARATVKVRVAIQNADQNLFPEMSATVYFLPETQFPPASPATPRIFCPNDAIHSHNQLSWVWIVDQHDQLRKTIVQIAERRNDRSEISSGLAGGEKVVVSQPKDFRDGLTVKTAQ